MAGREENPFVGLCEYDLRHLAEHMESSGRGDDLHRLLALETSEQSNAWYKAKDAIGDISGFLDDVARGRRLADKAYSFTDQLQMSHVIGLQLRYALITTSINSMAMNIPPPLLTALVEKGIWNLTQGLVYARRVGNPIQRAEAFLVLTPYLPKILDEQILQEIFLALQAIENEKLRAALIMKYGSQFPKQLTEVVLKVARAIKYGGWRADALAGLAPCLEEPLREKVILEAFNAAATIDAYASRAGSISRIAERAADLGYELKALDFVRTIDQIDKRAEAIANIANHIGEPLRGVAVQEVLSYPLTRTAMDAFTLTTLIPKLAPLGHAESVLKKVHKSLNGVFLSESLIELAPYLSESLREVVVQDALRSARENDHNISKRLAAFIPHLTEPLKGKITREAFVLAREEKNDLYRSRGLVALAPHLTGSLLDKAMSVAQGMNEEEWQAEVLIALATCSPEYILENVLAMVSKMGEEWQAKVLSGLAHHLPEVHIPEIILAAQEIRNHEHHLAVLSALVPYLSELQLQQLLATLQATPFTPKLQNDLFAIMASHLPKHLLEQSLTLAVAIQDNNVLDRVLSVMVSEQKDVSHSKQSSQDNQQRKGHEISETSTPPSDEQWEKDLQVAIADACAIENEWAQGNELRRLITQMTERGYYQEALATARNILLPGQRASAYLMLAPNFPQEQRLKILRESIQEARRIQSLSDRAKMMAALARNLPENLLREVLEEAGASTDSRFNECVISGAAPRLAELGYPEEALRLTTGINKLDHYLAQALVEMVFYLPESLLTDALEMSQRVYRDGKGKAEVLTKIATRLSDSLQESTLQSALSIIGTIKEDDDRAMVLKGLASQLPESLMKQALSTTELIKEEHPRAEALATLAPYLPFSLLADALSACQTLQRGDKQAMVISALSPRMNKLPRKSLYDLWTEIKSLFANRTREDLLEVIYALKPTITTFGGTEAVMETKCAIQDVGRWWP